MSNFNDRLQSAEALMQSIQYRVLFNKLGEYGIVPSSEQEATEILALADEIMLHCPRTSPQGGTMKKACIAAFGAMEEQTDGRSKEAHDVAEYLCKDASAVEAAKLILASMKQ